MRRVQQMIEELLADRDAVDEAIYALSRLGPRHRGRPFGSGTIRRTSRKER